MKLQGILAESLPKLKQNTESNTKLKSVVTCIH